MRACRNLNPSAGRHHTEFTYSKQRESRRGVTIGCGVTIRRRQIKSGPCRIGPDRVDSQIQVRFATRPDRP
jgi:hypothetical protein